MEEVEEDEGEEEDEGRGGVGEEEPGTEWNGLNYETQLCLNNFI